MIVNFKLTANFGEWSLSNFKDRGPGFQVFFDFSLSINIQPPIAVPFNLFQGVKQDKLTFILIVRA